LIAIAETRDTQHGATTTGQISIETAQSGLDLGVLSDLTDKAIILGVLDLSTPDVETPLVADRVPAARSTGSRPSKASSPPTAG
jgi:hypothetical protein